MRVFTYLCNGIPVSWEYPIWMFRSGSVARRVCGRWGPSFPKPKFAHLARGEKLCALFNRMSSPISGVAAVAIAAIALLVAFGGAAWGQTAGSGLIAGTLTDSSGGVVPGATVTIRHADTGTERVVSTNEVGLYSAPFLQPGHFEITAAKAGFAKVVRTGVNLQVGQTLTIDLTMPVKAAAEAVTVTGEGELVDTSKTEVSQVVSEAAVTNLPIAGRRWDSFVLLTPNVTTDGTSGLVSYRGISGLYNSNTVDGANNNQAFFSEARGRANSGAYVYSMDSIMEYQVSASNYSAELGQAAGGVVNAVTKSGSNAVHGDLFYYLRYPSFNALDSYPKSRGTYSQPIHQWQQFGGSVGGPIIEDKLFYFATYDGSRKVNPITYTSNVYSSTVSALPCPAQLTATQCATANAFLFGMQGSFPRATNQDVAFGRLDYNATARNHISTSFDFMNYRAPNAYSTSPSYNNSSLGTNGSYMFHERIFVANWDSTISNSAVNNLRFQWGRDLEVAGANGTAPYVNVGGSGGSSNLAIYGENYALPRTAEPDEHRIQISDTLSKVHGRHSFKAGLDVNAIHEVMINLYQGTGNYSYSGTAQAAFNNWVIDAYGINIGDNLTGRHYTTFTQVNDPITHVGKDDFYNNDWAAFFEDSWKANSKLTVNMGLRYDVSTIPQPPQPNTLTSADHALYFHHQHPQGPVRTAHRDRLAGVAENRGAHRLRHLFRQDHQQHLLRHPRGERRVSADVYLQPGRDGFELLPAVDVSQRDLDPAGRSDGRTVRRRADAAGGRLRPARRLAGDARHVARLGQSAHPRGRALRGTRVARRA